MSRASDTRWLYRIEDHSFRFNKYANTERSIEYLRRFANRVWRSVGSSRQVPTIRTIGGGVSWCQGYSEIRLCRGHRNILVLLHELTHALGPCVHGPRFVKLYFRLLNEHAGYSRFFLQGVAAGRGITV